MIVYNKKYAYRIQREVIMDKKALKVLGNLKMLNQALDEFIGEDTTDMQYKDMIEEYAKAVRFKLLWLGVSV